MITVVLAATVVSYSLYALSPEVATKLGTQAMPLIHHRHEGGNPTRILFTDRPLLLAVISWAAVVAAILYLS